MTGQKTFYPLTHPQKAIWYTEKAYPGTSIGNVAGTMRLKGKIDYNLLEKAINLCIEKNDALRLRIIETGNEPLQYITEYEYKKLDFCDFSKSKDINELYQWDIKMTKIPFKLIDSDLFYFALLKINENEAGVYGKIHHAIMDGWGIHLLGTQIIDFYNKLINKGEISGEKKPSYIDFIINETEYLKSEKFSRDKKYWNDKYETIPEFTSLKPRNVSFARNISKRKTFILSEHMSSIIQEFCESNRISIFTLVNSLMAIYIYRIMCKSDIVFGTSVLNRSNVKEKNTLGMFVTTIPIRLKINGNIMFKELIKEVSREWLDILRHQKYPYNLVLSDYREKHKVTEGLYDTTITYHNAKLIAKGCFKDFKIRWHSYGYQAETLNIHINDREDRGQYIIDFDYLEALFDDMEIEHIYRHFLNLLEDAMKNPDKKIIRLEILSKNEKNKLLYSFNNTKTDYPKDKTIHRLFEEQVKKVPDSIAIKFKKEQLSYRELNEKANKLARFLRNKGVGQDVIVGIMMYRSIEMIIAIIGILKAGGAYLPIDPSYPQIRILNILKDSGVHLLLTNESNREPFFYSQEPTNCLDITVLDINKIYNQLEQESKENLEDTNNSYNLAYVMYTSGSTGQPKGNLTRHFNIVRVVKNVNYIDINSRDIILQLSNYAFDGSTFDIFGSLLNGAKLILADNDTFHDVAKLANLIQEEKITLFFITTALFNALIDFNIECLKNVRKILFGGEKASVNHVQKGLRYLGKNRIIHVYGPTESTVFATYYPVNEIKEELQTIPIGKPISNTRVYIMDHNKNLQPIGVPGEIYIAGDGIINGYLNNEELTRNTFIENPYIPGEIIYKTGDLAKMSPDGNIEFIDRIDTQVKIRGFRIELNEIEFQLRKLASIKEALVIDKVDKNGNKYLCAYLISTEEISPIELKKELLTVLPEYMVPSRFVQIKKLPLTLNGKVDRKSLPEPLDDIDPGVEFVSPRNEIEQKLADIMSDVLGRKRIGIYDNFFNLGGDSIKAIQVAAQLRKYQLTLAIHDLFTHPTIEELVNYIKFEDKKINNDLIQGKVELTPIQRWFFDFKYYDAGHFYQSVTLYSNKGFEIEIIKKVFEELTKHHDALRMIYKIEDGNIIQINRSIENEKLFDITVKEFGHDPKYLKKINKEVNKITGGFSLSKGPLVKVGLYKTANGDYLFIAIHHLVVDGISWRIILQDFTSAYKQIVNKNELKLPDKTDSYQMWAKELHKYANSKKALKELQYWKEIESTKIVPLPKDNKIFKSIYKNIKDLYFTLPADQTKDLLKHANKAFNTHTNEILLTAVGLSIKEWAGIKKVLIDVEGHGRENILKSLNVTRTVGWFTVIYPVILDMTKTVELDYQIKLVKENFRRVPNKGVGYGILKHLTIPGHKELPDFSIKPEINFNYLGEFDRDINNDIFSIMDFTFGMPSRSRLKWQYTLSINAMIINKEFAFIISYDNKKLYKKSVLRFIEFFLKNLQEIINLCMKKEEIELTPMDYGDETLSLEELKEISEKVSNLF